MPVQKNIAGYLHYYVGKSCITPEGQGLLNWVSGETLGVNVVFGLMGPDFDKTFAPDEVKPILRKLLYLSDVELLDIGKLICAIPNSGYEYESQIKRNGNSLGVNYASPGFISGNYFTIWDERNKRDKVGHIEVGWFGDIDKRKTRENWRVVSFHEVTHYLLSKGFDIFNLIESGLAIDSNEKK